MDQNQNWNKMPNTVVRTVFSLYKTSIFMQIMKRTTKTREIFIIYVSLINYI